MYWPNPMHPTREQQMLAKLKTVFPDQLSRNYLRLFKEIDPTSSGKYVPWLVKMWMSTTTSWPISAQEIENLEEDAEILHELLQKFHRFKGQLPIDQRDILKHTKGSLATALKDFELPEETRSQLYEKQILEGTQIIHQDKDVRVIRITTPEAARELAKGTAWCITSLQVAADYIASGLLILIEKPFPPGSGTFTPIVLAHHGYSKIQSHVEADPEYHSTSQVKDSEDVDLQNSDPELFSLLQPYFQLAFYEAKIHRMRKFADAWDLQIYLEDMAEGRERSQRDSFDWSTGHGQLETDEEYLTRLIDLAANIFGGRDPWIEARIIETNDEKLLLKYIQSTGTMDPKLESYLKTKWIIESYIEWAYFMTKGEEGDIADWQARLEAWLALATRMRAKIQ